MQPTKAWSPFLPLLLAALLAVLPAAAASAEPQEGDRTLSPYFFVSGGDPSVDALPLKRTQVHVTVSGVVAEVTVRQTYENAGSRPLNARYVFPASTRAAVHGMRMVIGEHTIEARVKEREEARRTYERARSEGKSAALLEQQRPNVFSMDVANVMPGDRIAVELRYTELLVPTDGTYELVYPTVVGPRYSGQPEAEAPESDRWVKSPFLRQGVRPTSAFELTASLATGIPLQELSSPSHRIQVDWQGRSQARLTLDGAEKRGGDRDFILRYRLDGKQIQSGLLLHRGERENFFLLMVQPPRRVTPEQMPPREYVFVVDVSGSMHGFPLDTTKELLGELVAGLRPVDRFNVLLFSGDSRLMAPASVPASAENVARARRLLGQEQGGGGTELRPALERALALPRPAGMSRSFVVVTDGFISGEDALFATIRNSLGEANVFAFGIGSSVNRHLVDGVARAGLGEPFVVTEPGEARAVAMRFAEYVRAPVLTDIRLEAEGLRIHDLVPESIPDLLADRPLILQGKWTGAPEGSLTLRGVTGGGPFVQRFDVAQAAAAGSQNPALQYLWARSRIADLSDFNLATPGMDPKEELVALGLGYNLLTRYTSFVAVHEAPQTAGQTATDVEQPLPLPAGVSERAVEEGPEPELWCLLGLVLALCGWSALRRRAVAVQP